MGGEVSVLPEVIHDDADSREIHTCRVCANTYNHGDNAPVSLPCGHTFCKSCVMRIMTQNGVCCLLATCRKQHKVTSIDSFPVIYALIPQSTSSSNTASENNSTSRLFRIKLMDIEGNMTSVMVSPETTVREIKASLEIQFGEIPAETRVIYKGGPVKDESTMAKLGTKEGHTIQITSTWFGGHISTRCAN
ncbi:uncharacterized protein LOC121875181 [Homarus americanus]|uniref:uncharacterized protein LOC121875181 n=1 Tax=Homarus americanus TaxID=6706 RepID=UPI001C44AFA9|nr:uncharacterized protein LOC121875181 [Homarus americanus]